MMYRAWIAVRRPNGLSLEEGLAVLEQLNRLHPGVGAVGCGGDPRTEVYVLSARAPTEIDAVLRMTGAVGDAVRAAGLTDAYPERVELERVQAGAAIAS